MSNTKKRPNNIVMGRMFDNHLLDMFEFGIENYESIVSIKVLDFSLIKKNRKPE